MKDDTDDIKHLTLKVPLVKSLGDLSLVCFVIRVCFDSAVLSGCSFISYYPLGTGTCCSQTSVQVKYFASLPTAKDSQVLKCFISREEISSSYCRNTSGVPPLHSLNTHCVYLHV